MTGRVPLTAGPLKPPTTTTTTTAPQSDTWGGDQTRQVGDAHGYRIATAAGGIFTFGDAGFGGSTGAFTEGAAGAIS